VAWILVRRDSALGELAQLILGDLGTGLKRDRRPDLFAKLWVRDPDHRGLPHGGVLVEHFLDLARIHVVAATDDQLLLAIDDEEVSIFVDAFDVTAVEPAVVVDRLGCPSAVASGRLQ
jgi:hypothetical protein